ncbi:PseG/SpsG family protein [Calditrichota bacterium]
MIHNKNSTVLMRVDGGDIIGYGHIMRTVGLAQALADVGFKPVFYTRLVDGSGVETLRRNGLIPVVIPPFLEEEEEPQWMLEDLSRTIGSPGLIVVDGYHFSDEYWSLFESDSVLMATDVFGGRNYAGVDLIYNGYAHAEKMDYAQCKDDTGFLLGTRWLIIRDEVVHRIPVIRKRQHEKISQILVNGGGVDEHDVTGRVASALAKLEADDIPDKIIFTHGIKYPFQERLKKLTGKLPTAEVCVQPDNFVDLILDSDLVICAGGLVQYESTMLGTPSIALIVEENQKDSSFAMQELGITEVAGWLKNLSDEQILEAFRRLALDQGKRQEMVNIGARLLDGKGAERVAKACLERVNR